MARQRRSAEEWPRLHAEEATEVGQQFCKFRGLASAKEEEKEEEEEEEVTSDSLPRAGLGPSGSGNTVAMARTMSAAAGKVRWADLHDDDEDELSASELAFSHLSLPRPASEDAAEVELHDEVSLQKGWQQPQDFEQCDLNSNHVLEAGKRTVDQKIVTAPCCGGTTFPSQPHRVFVVAPFVFQEQQYFRPPLMWSRSSSSTFSATLHDASSPMRPLAD
eukprot:TRINITY_DN7474_c1_g1_i1.p2 TRINITY_DN7474_c1_g1~~TRINITY_DN7474_c1_g1_i1.p2  ORF type:complete len:219 (+),score=57.16 TRINITY_DN7474_c1_g1_i1:174-830(+)